jgi:hypothetical protein
MWFIKNQDMQNFGKSQTCQMAGAENHGSWYHETAGLPKRVVRFFCSEPEVRFILLCIVTIKGGSIMKGVIRIFSITFLCLLFTAGLGRASDPSLILSDDFSGNFTDNWIPGMAADQNGTHALSIEDGELVWVQQYDYIESKALFGNNLKVEFDYRAGPGSIQAGEFWVELVALTDAGEYTAGIYRSQYGLENYHAVNIGRAPLPSDSTVRDKILDPPYLQTMEPGNPRQGKITFTYKDQQVQMQFENADQETVTTGWVNTGDFSQTKIRIWGMGGSGGPRYIDNVKIYCGSDPVDPVTVSVHVLTAASPDFTVPAGTHARIYGTSLSDVITLESGAKAELINFPGYNQINIASSSGLFTVSRSGTVVTFQGEDGTILKIPATMTFQTIGFTDGDLQLSIQGSQVVLGDQVIEAEQSPVTGE